MRQECLGAFYESLPEQGKEGLTCHHDLCKSPIYLRDGIYSYTNNSIIRNLEISLLFHIMSSIYSIVTPVKRKRSHDYDPRGKKSKIIPYKVPKGFDIYNYLQI